ncbi:MAG: hypothetical protein HYU64_12075 [Armatimonadetes bacterium]|nr:hypothetical protein [Armatimonadota bacterium]
MSGKWNLWALVFLGLIGLALQAPLQAQEVQSQPTQVDIRIWNPTLSGEIQTPSQTGIQLQDDLGLRPSTGIVITAKVKSSEKTAYGFQYETIEHNNSRTLSRNITYEGVTFNANTSVSANLRYAGYEGIYYRTLTKSEKGELNFVGSIKYIVFSSSLKGVNDTTAAKDISVPLPTIGLEGKASVGQNAEVFGRIAGLDFKMGGTRASVLDLYGGARIKIQDWKAGLAYRYETIRLIDQNGSKGEIKESGPEFVLSKEF